MIGQRSNLKTWHSVMMTRLWRRRVFFFSSRGFFPHILNRLIISSRFTPLYLSNAPIIVPTRAPSTTPGPSADAACSSWIQNSRVPFMLISLQWCAFYAYQPEIMRVLCLSATAIVLFMLTKVCRKLKIVFTQNELLFQSGLSGWSFFPAKSTIAPFRLISLISHSHTRRTWMIWIPTLLRYVLHLSHTKKNYFSDLDFWLKHYLLGDCRN
jgi:hypothetical protein